MIATEQRQVGQMVKSKHSSYRYERAAQSSNSSTRQFFGAKSSRPTGVTIHHWGKDGQSHDAVVRWLQGTTAGAGNTGSSAHVVISAGRVTEIVSPERAAWHAGHPVGNGTTVGVEMRPEASAGDWQTMIEYLADLEQKYGSLRYYLHKDWSATACPGRYSSRLGEIVNDVNALHEKRGNTKLIGTGSSKGTTSKPKPKTSTVRKTVAQLANEVIRGSWGNGAERKRRLGASGYDYAAVQREVNRRLLR